MDNQELLSRLLDHGRPTNERIDALRLLPETISSRNAKARILDLLLQDQDPIIRMHAALASTRLGDATTIDMLYKMLVSEIDSDVARFVLVSLGHLLGTLLIPKLMTIFESGDSIRRKNALLVAGNILDARTTEMMLNAVKNDPDPDIRFLAATTLARWGRNEGVDVLLDHIHGVSDVEDAIAVTALCKLGEKAGYEELFRILARVDTLTPNDRGILAHLMRVTVDIAGEDDEV